MAHVITGNKYDPSKDIPDLDGKVFWLLVDYKLLLIVVPSGLCRYRQHNAARIILLSQKEEHADEAKEELKKYGDPNKVEWIQLDLKDLKQTDGVAKQLVEEQRIDAVRTIHNRKIRDIRLMAV